MKIKNIILFIICIVMISGISVYATKEYLYEASTIKYYKNGTDEMSVEEALHELYSKQPNISLVGHGEISYSSSVTTDTLISGTADDGNVLLINDNNTIFTTKRAGKYLINAASGSDSSTGNGENYYSGYIKLYINDNLSSSGGLGISQGRFTVSNVIVSLNAGDTIKFYYRGSGGDYPKKSLFNIYYIN